MGMCHGCAMLVSATRQDSLVELLAHSLDLPPELLPGAPIGPLNRPLMPLALGQQALRNSSTAWIHRNHSSVIDAIYRRIAEVCHPRIIVSLQHARTASVRLGMGAMPLQTIPIVSILYGSRRLRV